MNKIDINLWNRQFSLPVIFRNYNGEEITQLQKNTLIALPTSNFEVAKLKLERYIKRHNNNNLQEDEISNIFKYVIPKSIFIDIDSEKRVFAIMCSYKFDMEHGIALIFENEEFSKVGQQDIIL